MDCEKFYLLSNRPVYLSKQRHKAPLENPSSRSISGETDRPALALKSPLTTRSGKATFIPRIDLGTA